MSGGGNHYDPWMHGLHLFGNRVFQFVLLTLIVGGAWWAGLLMLVFHVEGAQVLARQTWAVVSTPEHVAPRVMLVQSLAIGAALTAWVFTWLMGRAKLRRGDRHHRGARVVDAHDE
jgi:hypothetical protein